MVDMIVDKYDRRDSIPLIERQRSFRQYAQHQRAFLGSMGKIRQVPFSGAVAIGFRLWCLHHCFVFKAVRAFLTAFYFGMKKHPRKKINAEIRQAVKPRGAIRGEGKVKTLWL